MTMCRVWCSFLVCIDFPFVKTLLNFIKAIIKLKLYLNVELLRYHSKKYIDLLVCWYSIRIQMFFFLCQFKFELVLYVLLKKLAFQQKTFWNLSFKQLNLRVFNKRKYYKQLFRITNFWKSYKTKFFFFRERAKIAYQYQYIQYTYPRLRLALFLPSFTSRDSHYKVCLNNVCVISSFSMEWWHDQSCDVNSLFWRRHQNERSFKERYMYLALSRG